VSEELLQGSRDGRGHRCFAGIRRRHTLPVPGKDHPVHDGIEPVAGENLGAPTQVGPELTLLIGLPHAECKAASSAGPASEIAAGQPGLPEPRQRQDRGREVDRAGDVGPAARRDRRRQHEAGNVDLLAREARVVPDGAGLAEALAVIGRHQHVGRHLLCILEEPPQQATERLVQRSHVSLV